MTSVTQVGAQTAQKTSQSPLKPTPSLDRFNSTVSECAKQSTTGKKTASCFSQFFGAIYNAIAGFFRMIFCLDCCTAPALDLKIVAKQGKLLIKEGTGGNQSLRLKILKDKNRAKILEDKVVVDKNASHEKFMTHVAAFLQERGVKQVICECTLPQARKLAKLGFTPCSSKMLVFESPSFLDSLRGKTTSLEKFKKLVQEAILKLQKNKKADVQVCTILGKIVAIITNTDAKVKLDEIKATLDANRVTAFTIKEKLVIQAALFFEGFDRYCLDDKDSTIKMMRVLKAKKSGQPTKQQVGNKT